MDKKKEIMPGQKIAYVRVSSVSQNDERQFRALEPYAIDKWFTEKVSAKDRNRDEFNLLLSYVREGDTVYVTEFSRIARNTKDLLNIMEEFERIGVKVVSLKENFDTSTANGKLMVTLMAAIYQFERELLLERQREGIAIAKERGIYKGRKRVDIDEEKFKYLYKQYKTRQLSKRQMAIELNVSRPTIDRRIKELEERSVE